MARSRSRSSGGRKKAEDKGRQAKSRKAAPVAEVEVVEESGGLTIDDGIPIITGINSDTENITRTGEFIASLPGVRVVNLLPYHNAARAKYDSLDRQQENEGLSCPADNEMDAIRDRLKTFGLEVAIGG